MCIRDRNQPTLPLPRLHAACPLPPSPRLSGEARAQPAADEYVDARLLQQRARALLLAAVPALRLRVRAPRRGGAAAAAAAAGHLGRPQLRPRHRHLVHRLWAALPRHRHHLHRARRDEQGDHHPPLHAAVHAAGQRLVRGGAFCVHRRRDDVRAGAAGARAL
eukprot:6199556-Pleurochrysis_carterae.AAC.4